jgi:hypothetical protein
MTKEQENFFLVHVYEFSDNPFLAPDVQTEELIFWINDRIEDLVRYAKRYLLKGESLDECLQKDQERARLVSRISSIDENEYIDEDKSIFEIERDLFELVYDLELLILRFHLLEYPEITHSEKEYEWLVKYVYLGEYPETKEGISMKTSLINRFKTVSDIADPTSHQSANRVIEGLTKSKKYDLRPVWEYIIDAENRILSRAKNVKTSRQSP